MGKNTKTKDVRNNKAASSYIIAFCVILGYIFRLLYCIIYSVQPRDAFVYEEILSDWNKTGSFHNLSFFPLSLWILRMPNFLFGYNVIKGGIIINILLGLLLIITIMKSTNQLIRNNKVMLLGGIALASHPRLVSYSCSFLRENTYLLFTALVVSFLIKYIHALYLRYLFGAGVFAALSFLCRLEGIELVIIANAILVFMLFFKKINVSTTVIHSLFFIMIICLTVITICMFMQIELSNFDLEFISHKVKFVTPNN